MDTEVMAMFAVMVVGVVALVVMAVVIVTGEREHRLTGAAEREAHGHLLAQAHRRAMDAGDCEAARRIEREALVHGVELGS